jgi:glycosyltransferase involved in cell wall biosynthesis
METMPRVTIGLPVYNSERYLRQSLESLLNQTYRDFVLVISDNASTDSTSAICQEYARGDSRVKYSRNPENIGNPRNFNRVFALTTTPFLKWSTSDDYWAPTMLERAMEVMERDPSIALCYPGAYTVNAQDGEITPYDDVLNLMQDDPADRFLQLIDTIKLTHQHLGVIRMDCLRRTGLLGIHSGSDINLLAELSLYGKFYELPERLFYRRFHETSGSWKRGDAKHEAKHYHGARKNRVKFTRWRAYGRFFASVRKAPLAMRAKTRIYRSLLRRAAWERSELLHELTSVATTRRVSLN